MDGVRSFVYFIKSASPDLPDNEAYFMFACVSSCQMLSKFLHKGRQKSLLCDTLPAQ